MAGVQVALKCGLLLLFVTNIAGSQDCHAIDQCSCKLDNGKIISLWEIDKRNGQGYGLTDALSRGFTYQYSPCSGLKHPNSECNGALACQTDNTDTFAIALNTGPTRTAYDSAAGQYQFIYSGTKTKLTSERLTRVTLACDTSKTIPTFTPVKEQPTGTYSFTVSTKCGCPGQCKYVPKQPSSKSSSNLSVGSVLCIVAFVLLIVYIIGGLVVNKYVRHKEGSEIIPNKDFWTDLPSMVKDGSMFTYRKVTGKKSDYQVIT